MFYYVSLHDNIAAGREKSYPRYQLLEISL